MTSPFLSLTWTDHVTGRQGHLVVDRLVRGVCSGGLRMRAGCTLEEVTGLARGMSLKEALHYDPEARYVPWAEPRAVSTVIHGTRRRTDCWCATCGRCGRTWRAAGPPARTWG